MTGLTQAFFRPTHDAPRRRAGSREDATTSGAGALPPTARAVLIDMEPKVVLWSRV